MQHPVLELLHPGSRYTPPARTRLNLARTLLNLCVTGPWQAESLLPAACCYRTTNNMSAALETAEDVGDDGCDRGFHLAPLRCVLSSVVVISCSGRVTLLYCILIHHEVRS